MSLENFTFFSRPLPLVRKKHTKKNIDTLLSRDEILLFDARSSLLRGRRRPLEIVCKDIVERGGKGRN